MKRTDSAVKRTDLFAEDRSFAMGLDVVRALREGLPLVATEVVTAVTSEVVEYRGARRGPMRDTIEAAVKMALAGFLTLAGRSRDVDPSVPMGPTTDGAYALGRGEARAGRTMDALLAAYRVGARVSWRGLAQVAATAGLPAATMAQFAELLFAYIDALSAASVSGHQDELTTSGRVRERYRERLAQRLLSGADVDTLTAAAERAGWPIPGSLTTVLLPDAQVHGALGVLGADTLLLTEELPGRDAYGLDGLSLLLVPDAVGADRRHLLRVLDRRRAVVGPARPWHQVRTSYDRAVRTCVLTGTSRGDEPVASEDHLAALVISADPEALADLRARVLLPLDDYPAATRARLAETLTSWLLHQGRRDEVAADLHVHAQTVRYRMGQVREAYGDLLSDPAFVRDAIIALPAGD